MVYQEEVMLNIWALILCTYAVCIEIDFDTEVQCEAARVVIADTRPSAETWCLKRRGYNSDGELR